MKNNRIKEVAQRKGITQQELADKMGVSLSSVHYYYKSASKLSIAVLEKIANALGVQVWQLVATEYEVIRSASGDVLTPDGRRYPIGSLRFCFDSLIADDNEE